MDTDRFELSSWTSSIYWTDKNQTGISLFHKNEFLAPYVVLEHFHSYCRKCQVRYNKSLGHGTMIRTYKLYYLERFFFKLKGHHLARSINPFYCLKGSVQRDVTWVNVDIGLKKSVLEKFFFNFKGTVSREEYKTGFNVYTTIEMNLLVEFTNPANNGLVHLFSETVNHELRAKSCEL